MERFIGYIGNASSKSFSELENSKVVQQDPISNWLDDMEKIYKKTKVKILGGCCGTNLDYMKRLTEKVIIPVCERHDRLQQNITAIYKAGYRADYILDQTSGWWNKTVARLRTDGIVE